MQLFNLVIDKKCLGDGDSSVVKRLNETLPYGN